MKKSYYRSRWFLYEVLVKAGVIVIVVLIGSLAAKYL